MPPSHHPVLLSLHNTVVTLLVASDSFTYDLSGETKSDSCTSSGFLSALINIAQYSTSIVNQWAVAQTIDIKAQVRGSRHDEARVLCACTESMDDAMCLEANV